ncbi:MAG: DUF721 domain-containing protein [bacterium]
MDSLDDVLDEFVDDEEIRPEIDAARLREEWNEIAGDELSSKLSVVSFQYGRLALKACNPSWSHQASMLKQDLKQTINDYFGYQLVQTIQVKN